MEPSGIPEPVLRFITEKIDTVPQLEALLLMWENGDRSWDCEEIAARIYVQREACSDILATLQRRGLLRPNEDSQTRFRYEPAWDESGQLMDLVSSTYRRRLVQVATFIHSRGPSSVRDFARAFDLKKDR